MIKKFFNFSNQVLVIHKSLQHILPIDVKTPCIHTRWPGILAVDPPSPLDPNSDPFQHLSTPQMGVVNSFNTYPPLKIKSSTPMRTLRVNENLYNLCPIAKVQSEFSLKKRTETWITANLL